ncbi:GTP cyclohydrolase, FolE2/MptA family [Desulfobulbus oligotrophicus]|uniref:GTP cyclohydrolase I FolE2 n=1 Tax=Desulfobulbus oligotrophicus TaxID=1909699 RepID=A0A7T5VDL5_9BACT|nr:GTP cyclohydrolase, FolE2/MptA family [Desulfobulbus oligotrophicus]QQG65938.1 GTP cyclohydrolase I FolE2 [Desulfobulbus oligotrophicus]
MKDIQSLHDSRRIDIRKVGVKSVTYPIIVLDKACTTQSTLARMNMYVNLPHHFKGTHMSRFIEILNRFHGRFNLKMFRSILEEMKNRLDAEAAHLEMAFPYFCTAGTMQSAPGMERYDCRLHGSLASDFDLVVEVEVPVRLSSQGCHENTADIAGVWGDVTVAVRMKHFLWIEDLIALVGQGVDSQMAQTRTVESMCRCVSAVLQRTDSFQWYKVVVKNRTTGYSTFASYEWPEQTLSRFDAVEETCCRGEFSPAGFFCPHTLPINL